MSLVKCHECRKLVSTEAVACPNCGAPPRKPGLATKGEKKTSPLAMGCLILLLGFTGCTFLIAIIPSSTSTGRASVNRTASPKRTPKPTPERTPKPTPKPQTAEELRRERVEREFSAWDGSHRGLVRYVKNAMHDDDSFEHVETRYSDNGDHIVVLMHYRGANVFGGIVKNWVKAEVDFDGNVLQILETSN